MGCARPQIPLSPHPSRPNPSRPKTVSTVKDVLLLMNLAPGIPNLRDLRGHRRAFSDLHTSQRNRINSYCSITLILPHTALCLKTAPLCLPLLTSSSEIASSEKSWRGPDTSPGVSTAPDRPHQTCPLVLQVSATDLPP